MHTHKPVLVLLLILLAGCTAANGRPTSTAGPTPAATIVSSLPATLSPSAAQLLATATPRSSPTPLPTAVAPTIAASPSATATRTKTGVPATAASAGSEAVILAAGDIAVCGLTQDEATAKLLSRLPGTILAVGDDAYPVGSASDFANCYAPSWGQLKSRTRPVPGNHEYATPGAAGYFAYFGSAAGPAGKGYYSFDAGAWHVVALNSEIDVGAGSAEEQWLRADLAAHPNTCTLAYWHQPRFSSGPHGSNARYQALWQALYDAGADVVLGGHDHDYERFAPQTPGGQLDPARGIREFVVGTGGAVLYPFMLIAPNSEFRNDNVWGVLKLALHPSSYDWQFISAGDDAVIDSGSGTCH